MKNLLLICCISFLGIQCINAQPNAVCQNINLYLDGAGNGIVLPYDVDGGSTGFLAFSLSQVVFTCADLGPNNVTLTIIDSINNTDNCIAIVTVIDTLSPTITCPGNQTETPNVNCQFILPDYTGLATTSDNCTASPTVTQSPVAGTVISGTTTIIFNAEDGSGNIGQCSFNVTLKDATSPTSVCQNINLYLNGAGNGSIVAADLDGGSIDNCGGLSFSASQTAFTCADIGPNNVTLVVIDGNSNTDNCVAVVTVIDTVSPTIICPGNQTETPNASCQFTLPDYTGLAVSADNCGFSTVTQSPVAGTVILGSTTITITANDGSGNSAQCTFDIILNEVTPPTSVCQNINLYLDDSGNVTIIAADLDGGSTDNCMGLSFSALQAGFNCSDIGPNNVTLTVTDGSSNSSNCVAVVTVIDTVSPTIACPGDQVICDDILPDYIGVNIAGDNCTLSPTLTQSPVAGSIISVNTIVTLTATDNSSNSVNCTFVVSPNNKNTVDTTVNACDNFIWNGVYYTVSDTVTQTLTNAIGCDSVVTLNLIINTVDILLAISNNTLYANTAGTNYRWLDCDNAYAVIAGETNQSYTAIANGKFAVEITQNGCIDTSACVSITGVGIDIKPLVNNINLYPNPTNRTIYIKFEKEQKDIHVIIKDIAGKTIEVYNFANSKNISCSLVASPGLYLIELSTPTQKTVFKVLKQ